MNLAIGRILSLPPILALAGCVAIHGVSNSNLVKPLPPSPTFQLENMSASDAAVARKIGQMIAYQILKRGFRNPAEGQPPELKVQFSFDVVPAGMSSMAITTIDQPRQKFVVNGNTVTAKPGTTTATTVTTSNPNYRKTIAVKIRDAKDGSTYWEGQVSEIGWCDQLFVTAPNILTLMFEGFPEDATNTKRIVDQNNPTVQEIRSLFPGNTDWGCR